MSKNELDIQRGVHNLRALHSNEFARRAKSALGYFFDFLSDDTPAGCASTSIVALYGPDAVLPSEREELGNPTNSVIRLLEGIKDSLYFTTPTNSAEFLSLLEQENTRGALVISYNEQTKKGHMVAVIRGWTEKGSPRPHALEQASIVLDTNYPEIVYLANNDNLVDLFTSAYLVETPTQVIGRAVFVVVEKFDTNETTGEGSQDYYLLDPEQLAHTLTGVLELATQHEEHYEPEL
ncbi:hypothetical protein A2630_04180 [Candidatus Woesebacteria bacterium RIFCSPHIGHO2_01_FULL_44_10]|uniref:Uncharacterized protein n=1 Tax=Candidatus Woesebacteria bacterium RIFCSPLOWO2_01_FULL_44_14 TaxID=1802525 RepID=A0A1F8C1D3_9BACT|nr:MAG: hypothetical protein A2630_04180 [Candidatus Woesebacteria bacterium RIFCSPHIGHO2_01_FULL_44_10]OGM55459.1 MAG: hypothetical protein A3F62_00515 [Candidatus Woesebacteria bacterium RIFCSPHIGHO2_12_FULL_44_11]OGM70133.1 MAG: hypothetical protein A2975_03595 [Candidatus Woesebacteria bacterium RIFCSPLOWO2_01_FULL_44_14]